MPNANSSRNSALEWRIDVSLLGQPTMVANFVKVIVISGGVMGALLAFLALTQGNPGEIVSMLQLTAVSVGVVAAIMLLVMIVFFRNRMSMAFRVDAAGARSALVDRRARAGGKAAPMFVLPYPITVDSLVPLIVLAFALVSVWLLPIFGWVVIGGLGWVAAEAIAAGLAPYTSDFTGETLPRFDLMSGDDWAEIAVALVGAAYLIGQSVALLKGRFESALAGDMNEGEPAPRPSASAESPPPIAPPQIARFCAYCGARLDAAGRCPSCGGAAHP